MRQEQKKKQKDRVAIVLMLCFCVIALTSIFTIKSNVEKINKSAQGSGISGAGQTEVPASDQTKVPGSDQEKSPASDSANKPEADQEKEPEPGRENTPKEGSAEVSSRVPIVESTPGSNSEAAEATSKYRLPLDCDQYKITNPFSMNGLIYSKTLDQYMTHQGIDIESPAGTAVVAAAEGTITAVFVDDRFGNTIQLSHGGGVKTVYSNLDDSVKVEIGDVVSRGAVIAAVGNSGAFEALEPAHLHFEIIVDEKYADPAEYISF